MILRNNKFFYYYFDPKKIFSQIIGKRSLELIKSVNGSSEVRSAEYVGPVDIDKEIDHLSKEKIMDYELGIYSVKIIKNNEEYLYYISVKKEYRDSYLKSLNVINKSYNRFLLSLPDNKLLREHDLRDLVKKVFVSENNEKDHDMIFYLIKQELGYGKLQVLIDDPYVEDISISGVGTVWVRHSYVQEIDPSADLIKTNIRINSLEEIMMLQNKIANKSGRSLSYINPILDVQLPIEDGGHRVHLVSPSIAGERAEIVIRKNILRRVSIEDLVKKGMFPPEVQEYLRQLIQMRRSIIIAGPPSSGKTTLLRAMLNSFVPKHWKVIIIEDTPEIEIPPDSSWVRYSTYESGYLKIDQYILTKAALRSSVNKIIVIGETRGAEARVLAQALNLGIGALTTFHGGSVKEVLTRLMSPPISLKIHQIKSINTIIVLGIENNKRIVKNIGEIIYSPESSKIRVRNIYDYYRDRGSFLIEKSYYVKSDQIYSLYHR
ncbi:MAG: type II/IV secretion system ATPase subunit [Sulfolobales archaeon]